MSVFTNRATASLAMLALAVTAIGCDALINRAASTDLRPVAVINSPVGGTVFANVTIDYSLLDVDADAINVAIEYSINHNTWYWVGFWCWFWWRWCCSD